MDLECKVAARDTRCIYCGVDFGQSPARPGDRPTWEHIVNDESIITEANIARCCAACNASKGARLLRDWLESDYCRHRGISPQTVARVVVAALTGSRIFTKDAKLHSALLERLKSDLPER
jgi:hypothetical protein